MIKPTANAACTEFKNRLFQHLLRLLNPLLSSKTNNSFATFSILIPLALDLKETPALAATLVQLAPLCSPSALCCILTVLTELLEYVSTELPQGPSSNPCSFVQKTGPLPTFQHGFQCLTCTVSSCCSVCATVCHAKHDVIYSGQRIFVCDCGATCDARTGLHSFGLFKPDTHAELCKFSLVVLRQLSQLVRDPGVVYLPSTGTLTPTKSLTTGLFAQSSTPSASHFLQGLLGVQLRRDTGVPKIALQPQMMAVVSPNLLVIAEGSRLNIFNRLKPMQLGACQSKPSSKPRTELKLLTEETMPFNVLVLKANRRNPGLFIKIFDIVE